MTFRLTMNNTVRAFLAGLASVLTLGSAATAQPCAPTPTGVFAEWSACNNGPRINWTIPAGQLLFPRLYRAATPNVADAVQVAQFALNVTSGIDESAPANVDLYYWVQFEGLNGSCQFSALAGPVIAQRRSQGSSTFVMPPATITPLCNGLRLDWPRVRENFNSGLLLRRFSTNPNIQVDFPLTPNTTTFTDTSGTPGVTYVYNVFFLGTCRGTEGTKPTDPLNYPPLSGALRGAGANAVAGGPASLNVDLSGFSPAVQSVQWFKDGSATPLPLGGRINATADTLTFNPVLQADAGLYTARASTGCATIPEVEVGLIVGTACPADFDGSGQVSVQDLFEFLSAFFTTCP